MESGSNLPINWLILGSTVSVWFLKYWFLKYKGDEIYLVTKIKKLKPTNKIELK